MKVLYKEYIDREILRSVQTSGLHPHGRGDPVQEGPEVLRREDGLQGDQAEQPHNAQLQTNYR